MQLALYTWNGNAINDGTNFTAVIPPGQTMPGGSPQFVDRGQSWPFLAGKTLSGAVFTFKIIMRGNIPAQLETLKSWFRSDDYVIHKLIAKDAVDGDRQWYLEGYAITPPTFTNSDGSSEVIVQIALKDPLWRESTAQTDIWAITASGQTKTMTVRGNYTALPTLDIKPTTYKAGYWNYKRFISLYNRTGLPFTNYPFSIGLDTAALVTASKMRADGYDLRIIVDGVEVDRWLYNMNTTTTQAWINISLKAAIQLTGITAIAGTGGVSTVTFTATVANKAAIKRLPSVGLIQIDSEIFYYAGVNTVSLTLAIVERASRGSTMAAHTGAATVIWLEHDVWLQYGNLSAPVPDVDDNTKPIIDLDANSNNTQWKYSNFNDAFYWRSGNWKQAVISGATYGQAFYYEGSHTDREVNPATEMGVALKSYPAGGVWKAGTGSIMWSLYHPAGITQYTVNLDRYRAAVSWPSVTINKSADGVRWILDYTVPTPSSAASWITIAPGLRSLAAAYKYLNFAMIGTVSGIANNMAASEVDDITIVLSSSAVPLATIYPEQADNYLLTCTIVNATTGEWVSITYVMALNQTISVNCDAQTIINSNGGNAISAIYFSTPRTEWLSVSNGDVLAFYETGAAGLTITLGWVGRNLI